MTIFENLAYLSLPIPVRSPGHTNAWIKSFLTNRIQSVVLDGISSSSVHVTSGVPQGSVLGPCLFLFYINDIAQTLHSTTCLFADDTMIYMAMKNESDAKLMQQDLDTLQDWEKRWMMEFHPDKCEVSLVNVNLLISPTPSMGKN